MLAIKILTAYPDIFPGSLKHSIIGKALKEKKWSLQIIDLHKFGYNQRKSIDDEPFGGGPGMVIRPDVVEKALLSIKDQTSTSSKLVYLTPAGKTLKQSNLLEFSQFKQLIILCGRFEGVDERAVKALNFEEISIGDYVLAGYGTGAVMAVPCGDQRDYDFAKHFDIEIPNIFDGVDISEEAFADKEKTVIGNSDFLNGLGYKEATKKAIEALEEIDIVQPELSNSLSLNNRLNNLKTVIESLN